MPDPQCPAEPLQDRMIGRAVSGFHVVGFGEVNRITARHMNLLVRLGNLERCAFGWSNPKANIAYFAAQNRRERTPRGIREKADA